MLKLLLTISALQTLPFGIGAMLAPGALFNQFGVSLNSSGELIARGYGATLIGYGITLWGLRASRSIASERYTCVGLALFNATEAFIQFHAGFSGEAHPIIFGNAGLHAVLAVASAGMLMKLAKQVAEPG
jgi:hypothetical protein